MIKNKIRYCALLAVLAFAFPSCLKDKAFVDVSNTQAIVEFSTTDALAGRFQQERAVKPRLAEFDTYLREVDGSLVNAGVGEQELELAGGAR